MRDADEGGDRVLDWPADDDRLGRWAAALLVYVVSSLIVFLGLGLGEDLILPSPYPGHMFDTTKASYANWDGQWYTEIATKGYSFDPDSHSGVAFFPAYPVLGRLVARATGLRCDQALVVVSNVLLAATFVLLAEYLRGRGGGESPRLVGVVLLCFGLIPTSFFFRVAYTESLFLFLTTLTFLGIRRHWPLVILAAVIGLATATRAVGVALIPALAWHVWRRSPGWPTFAVRMALLAPVACWGLLAYMAYLNAEFGDPLTFARAQAHWRLRPPTTPATRLFDLATFEPIRALYDPSTPGIGGMMQMLRRSAGPLFTLRMADPAYFLGAVLLVVLGVARRWLTAPESLTAAGLLLIPYATIGYEQYMQSMARYSSAVLPAYFVLGRLLCRAPAPLVAALAGLGGFFLGAYAALFAAWHLFI